MGGHLPPGRDHEYKALLFLRDKGDVADRPRRLPAVEELAEPLADRFVGVIEEEIAVSPADLLLLEAGGIGYFRPPETGIALFD